MPAVACALGIALVACGGDRSGGPRGDPKTIVANAPARTTAAHTARVDVDGRDTTATGVVDFANLFWSLDGHAYPSLEAAKAAGAATVNYGLFINNLIAFLIVAFAVFLVVQAYDRVRTKEVALPEPSRRDCSAIGVSGSRTCARRPSILKRRSD